MTHCAKFFTLAVFLFGACVASIRIGGAVGCAIACALAVAGFVVSGIRAVGE